MQAPFYRQRPILVFAVLGAVSGFVSSLNTLDVVQGLSLPAFYYGMPPDHQIPLWPAIAFAVALCVAAWLTLRPEIGALLALASSVFIGWWVVMEFVALPVFTAPEHRVGAALLFGFTGAFIVALGGAIAGLYSKRAHLALIGLVGAAAGLLMLVDTPGLWLLFVGWQAAVGAAIGYALTRSSAAAGPALSTTPTPV